MASHCVDSFCSGKPHPYHVPVDGPSGCINVSYSLYCPSQPTILWRAVWQALQGLLAARYIWLLATNTTVDPASWHEIFLYPKAIVEQHQQGKGSIDCLQGIDSVTCWYALISSLLRHFGGQPWMGPEWLLTWRPPRLTMRSARLKNWYERKFVVSCM